MDNETAYEILLMNGDNYLPDEIISGGFRVDGYSDIEISDETDNLTSGTCVIETHDDSENRDISFNSIFSIELDNEGMVSTIEFSNVEMNI